MTRPKSNPALHIDLGGGAALLAVLALIVILGIRPITRLQNEQAARDDRLEQLDEQIAELDTQIESLRDDLAQMTDQIESRQFTLLTPGDLNARIATVIERATAHGLEVLAIKPGELSDGEHHGHTPIDIGLSGPLPKLVQYLHAMRSESADLIVQQLEIRASNTGPGIIAHIRTDWLTSAE